MESRTEVNKIKDEANYNRRIQEEKEYLKQEISKLNTKTEKLLYIKQQKQKYLILKESRKMNYLTMIMISSIILISIILLLQNVKSNIFMLSFIYTLIVVDICISVIFMANLKSNNIDYLISLFALEDIEEKVSSTLGGSASEVAQLKDVMKNMTSEIERTRQQVKESYSIIDQRFYDIAKKML